VRQTASGGATASALACAAQPGDRRKGQGKQAFDAGRNKAATLANVLQLHYR
jgi:hypothetical protein